MRALVQLFWFIATFKKGPDSVPYSWPLLIVSLLINVLMAWHQFGYRVEIHMAFLYALLLVGIMVGFSFLVLLIKGHAERSVQVITALMGVNILINAFLYPLIFISPIIQMVPVLLYFILMIVISLNVWLLMITAHIYSRALVLPFLGGVVIAVALFGVDLIVFARLLPPT